MARLVDVVRGFVRSRRAQRRLRQFASEDPTHGFALIPGHDAFVAGWPHGTVFIGEEVANALDANGLAAVAAHERAHVRRGDVYVRALARIFATSHLPGSTAHLVSTLDLAMEEACDRDASVEVRGADIVAHAIAAAASTRTTLPDSVVARIHALRSPVGGIRGPIAATVIAAIVAIGLGISFDHQIHSAAERLALLLNG